MASNAASGPGMFEQVAQQDLDVLQVDAVGLGRGDLIGAEVIPTARPSGPTETPISRGTGRPAARLEEALSRLGG